MPTIAPAITPTIAPTIAPIIDLIDEAEETDITYPTVSELLAELDESMPALGFAQYEDRLLATGFAYVHQLMDTPTIRTALDDLQIPVGVVEEIINRANRMVRRATKSKYIVKSENDADSKF